jgi:hypothetical protein
MCLEPVVKNVIFSFVFFTVVLQLIVVTVVLQFRVFNVAFLVPFGYFIHSKLFLEVVPFQILILSNWKINILKGHLEGRRIQVVDTFQQGFNLVRPPNSFVGHAYLLPLLKLKVSELVTKAMHMVLQHFNSVFFRGNPFITQTAIQAAMFFLSNVSDVSVLTPLSKSDAYSVMIVSDARLSLITSELAIVGASSWQSQDI